MATRDQALAQYSDAVRSIAGREPNAEDLNDFNGYWNNASRDSGAYQSGPNGTTFAGSIYDQTWEMIWPAALSHIQGRAASTSHRTADSQSAEGNALYGSGTGNATNEPGGAQIVSPYVPLTVTGPVSVPVTQAPAVGPTGLAYAPDPVNYATREVSPRFGYEETPDNPTSGAYANLGGGGGGSYALPSSGLGGGSAAAGSGMFGGSTGLYLALGALALGAVFLLKQK